MEINIKKDALLKYLPPIANTLDSKNIIPILSHILFHFENDQITLLSSDVEQELEVKFDNPTGTINKKVAIPGKTLYEICKNLSSPELIFSFSDIDKLNLKTSTSSFNLNTMDAQNFPRFEQGSNKVIQLACVKSSLLKEKFKKIKVSMGKSDSREYFNGCCFDIVDNQLSLVTSDGHRLSIAQNIVPLSESEESENFQFVLPRSAVEKLSTILDLAEEFKISYWGNSLSFEAENIKYNARILDVKFPDYQAAIPLDIANFNKLEVNVEILKNILNRVKIILQEKDPPRFIFSFNNENSELQVYSKNMRGESVNEKIVAQYSGDEIKIAFNVHYILDLLSTYSPSSKIVFYLLDVSSSALIESLEENDGVKNIVMPMSL